ncbi:MAG TPA: CYTH and CHAD domain-containing protein [Micromonosporaceae bacterium]
MLQEERKYDVGPLFALPDLRAALPHGVRLVEHAPVTLRLTYHDTPDLRLARNGVSLRYRRGSSGPPWSLRLPTDEPHVRREITARGLASRVPDELARLVLGHTRSAALSPVATLSTVRRTYQVLDDTGTRLAEVVDDRVSVLEGRRVVSRFRQVGLLAGLDDRRLLDAVEPRLFAAGANPDHTPKQVRALGPLAAEPPDLPPAQPLGTDPSAADIVIEELRRETGRLVDHDLAVRVTPEDAEALDQLRVACRRLRTDLRTFSPLFTAPPTRGRLRTGAELLDPLRDLAGVLQGATAPRLLRARIAGLTDGEAFQIDLGVLVRLDKVLEGMARQAGATLATFMAGTPYARLLDGLTATARAPRLGEVAHSPAAEVVPALAATFWERLAQAVDKLFPDSGTEDWRAARRSARRLRRLSRLAAAAVGKPAQRLVDALDPVIGLLDVEREAHRATDLWLTASETAASDRTLAIAVGRLVEREYVLATSARESFRSTWDEQPWRTATEWLV